ncbi:MAG: shikimate kinase, partial [Patescibacteria group bacterium]
VQGPHKLKSLGTVDMNETPDLVMTFAVLAMFTEGKTKITNIGNLRIKETDRISALENELKKLGARVKTGKDWIEIESPFPGMKNSTCKILPGEDSQSVMATITINTYDDHRMAMAFGIITDIFRNLTIENPSCVSKSYTTFWKELEKCGTHQPSAKTPNLILTGLRGSGKSKIGKLLAEKLKLNFIDIDEEIEKHEKMTIKEIVELRGWEYFRAVENLIAKKIGKLKNAVISTGGGTIIDRNNEKALKKNGKIIYLYVKPEICAKRILNSKNRPPLTNKETVEEEIKHLYKERNGRYCESANLIFERTGNLEKDAEKIIKKLNLKI